MSAMTNIVEQLFKSLDPWPGFLLAVSDSETKHPTAILRLNPTKET